MKVILNAILARRSLVGQGLVRAMQVACFFGAVACHNYTTAPLCNESNRVDIPGLTSTYTISFQDSQTFAVTTQEVSITAPTQARGQVRIATAGKVSDVSTCNINGVFISEEFAGAVEGYQQHAIFVTGMGLTSLNVMFDKPSLDAAGITAEIFSVPDSGDDDQGIFAAQHLAAMNSEVVRALAKTFGLKVHTEGQSSQEILRHAKISPAGLTLLRK